MPVVRTASFNRHPGLRSLLILLVLLIITNCERSDPSGTVTWTVVGDTLFVTTVQPQVTPPPLFDLERDLVLGVAEGEEPYMLTGITSVAADEFGRIYIGGQRIGEVRIFDSEGSFVSRFGRRGEGPGEFSSRIYWKFTIYPIDDYIAVEDMPYLRVFDREGGYLHSYDFGPLITDSDITGRAALDKGILWFPDLQILATVWEESVPGPYGENKLCPLVVNEDMMAPRFLPHVMEPKGLYMAEGVGGFTIPFTPSFYWIYTGRHTLVWGLSDHYRLNIYNAKKDEWIAAVLDCDPIPVTSNDIEAFKEHFLSEMRGERRGVWEPKLHQVPYPKQKPFFNGLIGDDQGRIWVLRSLTSWEAEPPDIYQYDLFNSSGEWLGRVESPGELLHVRGDHVYMRGKMEYPTLERYRLIPSR